LIGGLILGLFLAPQLEGVASPEDVELSGGQIVLAAVLNFLAFAIGGFIVGLKPAGRTILEPGISAAVAVLIALLISANFAALIGMRGGLSCAVYVSGGCWAQTALTFPLTRRYS
jgi:hypothetical protein